MMDKPGYDISLRALFYCARMISSQQGKEFTTHADDPVKYGNIKKVYSIWICTETAQKRANSIEKYDIRREFLVGSNDDNPRYDIMNAILINISEKHDTAGIENETIQLLTDLFDERISSEEKVIKLQNEYGLPMIKDYEEVLGMCTYADAIERKGMEKAMLEVATEMLKERYSLDSILRISKLPKEKIISIAESLKIQIT